MPQVSDSADPTLDSIREAARRISNVTSQTPVRTSSRLSEMHGAPVLLKLETVQPTGSFKVRGAANAVLRQRETRGITGVVTASTGNHGRAVAYVARTLGIGAIVCLAKNVPQDRIDSIRAEGAQVDLVEGEQNEAIRHGKQLAEDRGYSFITPFDAPDIISGQGTIGLELYEQAPNLGTIFVPYRAADWRPVSDWRSNPSRRTLASSGVSAERTPTMARSLAAGQPVATEEIATIAGSLMGDLGPDNKYSFRLVQKYVDDMILITEDEIRAAMRWALREERLVIEGAAAVVVAHILDQPAENNYGPTVAIITGDNVASDSLSSAAQAIA